MSSTRLARINGLVRANTVGASAKPYCLIFLLTSLFGCAPTPILFLNSTISPSIQGESQQVLRSREVLINPKAELLFEGSADNNTTTTLNLFDDTAIDVDNWTAQNVGSGEVVWKGNTVDETVWRLFISVKDHRVVADIQHGSRTFRIEPLQGSRFDGRHRVSEIDSLAFPQEAEPLTVSDGRKTNIPHPSPIVKPQCDSPPPNLKDPPTIRVLFASAADSVSGSIDQDAAILIGQLNELTQF